MGGNAKSSMPVPDGWPGAVDFHKAPSAYNWADAIAVTYYIYTKAPSFIPLPLRERVAQQARRSRAEKRVRADADDEDDA